MRLNAALPARMGNFPGGKRRVSHSERAESDDSAPAARSLHLLRDGTDIPAWQEAAHRVLAWLNVAASYSLSCLYLLNLPTKNTGKT